MIDVSRNPQVKPAVVVIVQECGAGTPLRIAANACMDVLRRRQRLRWLPWEGARHERASSQREDDPEDTLLGDETQRAVTRVLQAMSPRNRQAMILREYEGLSCEDIGEIMGVSRSAVKSMIAWNWPTVGTGTRAR